MLVNVTDISSAEMKKILKKRAYFFIGYIFLFLMAIFGLEELFSDVSRVSFFKKITAFSPILILTMISCSASVVIGLRKHFYIRMSQVEIESNVITVLINNKKKTYNFSKFKSLLVVDSQDLFSKDKRTFIILQSKGILGLFKKSILIRDVEHSYRELVSAELSDKLKLPINNNKYWVL